MGKKKGGGGESGGRGNGANPPAGGSGGGQSGVANDPIVGEEVKSERQDGGAIAVVMRVQMNCEGCCKTVKDSLKGVLGIEKLTAEIESNKLTVVGKVDPIRIRDRVERKTRKKVELLSPLPGKKNESKKDENKPKEPQASTVVLKIRLHCEGCAHRIRKKIMGIKGVATVSADPAKELVTVKGIMDPKTLPGMIKEKLKKPVEVVPPKKDGAEEKKEKDREGGEKKEGGSGGSGKNQKGGDASATGAEGRKVMEYCYVEYSNPPYHVQAPQYFSDENPNACFVM